MFLFYKQNRSVMSNLITKRGRWKSGESGNPKGRPPVSRALTEMLRLEGDQVLSIGGEAISAKVVLARAVWQFVTTGEVLLAGTRLKAETINDWASVVKWLYAHIEPPQTGEPEQEPEMVVRIVRVDEED
jgi:hypothetical protein